MARETRLDEIARDLVGRATLKAKSLIVTVFGDALVPHGGTVWLGSLIALMAPFGLNERLVRTAVLRLSREGWLASRPIGRRSYYGLTEIGRHRFDDAHRRIYAAPRGHWGGRWHIVFTGLATLTGSERARLKRELAWQGFGALSPNLFVHPSADPEALRRALRHRGAADHVVVMRAASNALTTERALHELVRSAWDLEALARQYRSFLDCFEPVWRALQRVAEDRPPLRREGALDPAACFLIRVLLIHEYRRVLLRDPQLPEELLPSGWAGAAARLLCLNIYRRAAHPAERHLMATLETAEGPLPEAAPYFYRRFGGLAPVRVTRDAAAE